MADPLPGKAAFGEKCVADGAEPSVVGCKGEDFCLSSGPDSYCTRLCDIDKQCPDGFGCRGIETGRAECRRGLPNDEYYTPMAFPDGAFPDPPDATPAPMQAVEQEGGDDEKAKDAGCQAGLDAGASPRGVAWLALALTALWLRPGRRSRRT